MGKINKLLQVGTVTLQNSDTAALYIVFAWEDKSTELDCIILKTVLYEL